jgi:lipoprotein-anchoring transpeptidase ErfK/SrfK
MTMNTIRRSIFLVALLAGVMACASVQAGTMGTQNSKRAQLVQASTRPPEDYAKYYFICSSPDSKHDQTLTITYILISLSEQRLYAYHGNEMVAWSNVSTGKAGHETPVGTFKITQKHIDHYSSIYNNAPMPYFMRLTNDGVGLHAGMLPGYAASHGCIRLPMGMVKELYQHTASGTPVQVIAGPVDPSYASNKNPSFFPQG